VFKITDKLYVGNADDEKRAVHYVRLDMVDRVLVVAQDMEPTCGCEDGVEYMHVGLVDGPGNPLAAYHAAVLALVSLSRRGRVLVCCHSGGRSLAVAMMYLCLMCLPEVHECHRRAYERMDWGMMRRVLEEEVTD
jgi:hypothetical protein